MLIILHNENTIPSNDPTKQNTKSICVVNTNNEIIEISDSRQI